MYYDEAVLDTVWRIAGRGARVKVGRPKRSIGRRLGERDSWARERVAGEMERGAYLTVIWEITRQDSMINWI